MMWWGFAFIVWFFFLFIRLCYNLMQSFHWQWSGTFMHLSKTRRPDSYKETVQLLRVLLRYKVDNTLQPPDLNNFILAHYDWVDPEYILRDNVSLYCIYENEAVFVECFQGYDPHRHAFFTIGQYEFAKNVLIMPLHIFQKMADKVGNPAGNIVYIAMTSRCGSTLICDALSQTGKCVVLSEPFTNVLSHIEKNLPEADFDKLVGDQMRILCKPLKSTGKNATYVIKMSPPVNNAIPYLNKVFKPSKNIFMYRNGLPVVKSIFRVAKASRFSNISFLVNRWYPSMIIEAYRKIGFRLDITEINNSVAIFSGIWIKALEDYLWLRAEGVKIPAFKYEDIMADPLGMTAIIFEHCGLDASLADNVVPKAFSRDSQRGTYLSRDNMTYSKDEEKLHKPEYRNYVDNLCDELGLPRLDEDARLVGTVTTTSHFL